LGHCVTLAHRAPNTVDAMLVRFGMETIQVDLALARRAAAVRVRTRLKLPDAYALATAIHAEKRGHGDVRLESFDEKVLKAYKALHPITPELG
jgi:predicted nucleic acid-binding protein